MSEKLAQLEKKGGGNIVGEYQTIETVTFSSGTTITRTVPKGSLVVLATSVGGGPYSIGSLVTPHVNLELVASGPTRSSGNYILTGAFIATDTNISFSTNSGAIFTAVISERID